MAPGDSLQIRAEVGDSRPLAEVAADNRLQAEVGAVAEDSRRLAAAVEVVGFASSAP